MEDITSIRGGSNNSIEYDVTWNAYKNIIAMNPSTLVHGIKSMKHLKNAWENGRPDTPDFLFGRACHTMLFEPQEYEKRYAIWEGRRQGNDYKDFVNECWEKGQEVLTDAQNVLAQKAAKSFISDPLVKRLISSGKAEVTLFCVEEDIQYRGRVDWISASQHRLVDLKTAQDISANRFGRDFYKYHYDVKLGLYQRWLNKLTNSHWPVSVICLEKEEPFDVSVVPIDDAVMERGVKKAMKVMHDLRLSLKTGIWPGIARGEEYYLDTPTSEMDDDDLEGAMEVDYGE